jgi:hypothetical protein
MWLRFAVALLVACAGAAVVGPPGAAGQDRKEREVTILSPKEGARVGQFEEIEGRRDAKEGWPVVLVQPLAPGQPWWVQAAVEEVTDGKFTANVQIGDDKTKPGTKFRLVVVLAKDREAAQKFEAGMTRNSLPAGLPRSEPVQVVRKE